MDVVFLHFVNKSLKVRKSLCIYRKILVAVHVINVHIDHVKWHMSLAVFGNDLAEILRLFVTPAALTETKGKARRDIGAADDVTELAGDVIGIAAVDDVEF